MRSNTITLSIISVSIKSVTDRLTVGTFGLGNAVRSVLHLTFLRDRAGYQPQPAGPGLKRHSPHDGSWCFKMQSDAMVRLPGLTRFALSAARLMPVAAHSAAMDLVRAERLRRAPVR